jgi:hypothetical protein
MKFESRIVAVSPSLFEMVRFGAGAQDANVFITFDASNRHTMQGRPACTEIEADPAFVLLNVEDKTEGYRVRVRRQQFRAFRER